MEEYGDTQYEYNEKLQEVGISAHASTAQGLCCHHDCCDFLELHDVQNLTTLVVSDLKFGDTEKQNKLQVETMC